MATKKNIVRKLSGLTKDGSPNVYWQKFKLRLDNYGQKPIDDWSEEDFLGHILKRYKDTFGSELGLSYSGPPTKCREIYCMKRMILTLGVSDNQIIKDYIDWTYDSVIIPSKIIITSLAYFFTVNIISQFKQSIKKKTRLNRTSILPSAYISIIEQFNLNLNTYGDLAFAKLMMEEEESVQFVELFNELKKVGFDDKVLEVMEG